MNDQERAELEGLKRQQAQLLEQVSDLKRKTEALETRLTRAETPAAPPLPEIKPITLVAPPIIATALEPVALPAPMHAPKDIPNPVAKLTLAQPAAPIESKAQPPPLPKAATPPPLPQPVAAIRQTAGAGPATPVPPASSAKTPKPASFEMRIGTYWLVRIGIVMLLTGLVFFGAYAYENFVGKLTAGGKIALLYLASGALAGVGAWLQRKEEAIRNYAQVLVAGGLAGIYFTTYAAHHIPALRIIQSPTLDGLLLFAWAGFTIWLADRKKSEVLALFALLLAYYTSVITHVGMFTLYSNLVLTIAAVFFLVRNRWATVTFASLIATYASYAFWRFFQDGQWQFPTPQEGLLAGNCFLMAYWVLFTAAVFLSNHEAFAGGRRAAFLSLNNGAFFAAFVLTMLQVHQGGFWKFCLIYGAVLVGLAFLARRTLAADKLAANSYLTQGLLLVTLGFLTYYTGLRLSLVLAVESVMLVVLGQQLKDRVMQAASLVAAFLAVGWGMSVIKEFDRNGLIMGAAVGALMLFSAFWMRGETAARPGALNIRNLFYTVLGLGMWLFTTWQNTTDEWRGLVLAGEATVFLLATRPLGNQILKYGAYSFSALATAWGMYALGNQYLVHDLHARVGLVPGIAIGALMLFGALWERRSAPKESTPSTRAFHPLTTFYSALAQLTWLAVTCVFTPREFLAPLLAVEAVVFTAAFYPLRLAEIALFGQFFLLLAQLLWVFDATANHVSRPWWNPALIIAITLALAQWWQRQKSLVIEKSATTGMQGIYALAVVGLLYYWLQPRFDGSAWLAFTSVLAIALTIYGALNRYWLLAAAGQFFVIVSGWQFVSRLWDGEPEWYLPLVPILALSLLSYGAIRWFASRPDATAQIRTPILQIGQVYRLVALAMSLWWVDKYIPARENCWALAMLGLLVFLLGGWRRNLELLIFSGVYTVAGLAKFWLHLDNAPTVYIPTLIAILLVLAQQRIAKLFPDRYRLRPEIHGGAIVIGALSLWLFVSRWVLQMADGFYLTAGWSVLALVLFIFGMAVRERVYRWMGLAVLGCSLGRVVFVDVWNLHVIYRVLSFMALGVVLLVLGFIYNRYQEKIKEWL